MCQEICSCRQETELKTFHSGTVAIAHCSQVLQYLEVIKHNKVVKKGKKSRHFYTLTV